MISVRTKLIATAVAATATLASVARADSLGLRDGTVLTGSVRQVDGGFEVTLKDGTKRFVPSANIRSIKIDSNGKPDEATARERLASLRRSAENERDATRSIERYEQYLELNDGTAAAAEARKDLATWRDRVERKMVRVGKAWLTPADRDALYVDVAKRADEIRAALAADDLNRASTMLRDATALDPDNVALLYLNGVLQYRRNQFNEAKQKFDAVAEQVPDHPPTLVNQAVLLARFKRWPQAAAAFDAAMAGAPNHPDILANVTEFIQLVPEAARKSPALDKMMRRYGVQEAALEQQMAESRQLYRWGSTWVDRATLDKFRKEREESEKAKREMQTEFDQSASRLRQIDEDERRVNNLIAAIERESYVRDVNTGQVFQRPYPDSYWDLKRDAQVLVGRRRDEMAKQDELRKKAADLVKDAPAPPYRGTLDIVGEAGVPIVLPTSASDPTSRPSSEASASPTTEPALSDEPSVFIPFRDPDAQPAASQPAR